MGIADEVGRVCRLPDEELLAGLSRALGSSRGWTALVLAHLAEVEERRLHLIAGHGSMFAYCTVRLGMSEDEACRRIEVARLARRHPILYEKLASGDVSLSVAALLKHHLTGGNHAELLAAVAGKTVAQAREVLAAWFPQPDVRASIRKLPQRPGVGADVSHASEVPVRRSEPATVDPIDSEGTATAFAAATAAAAVQAAPAVAALAETPPAARAVAKPTAGPVAPRSQAPIIEPLSPDRYKIVFTADTELKRKLELAADLLRHAVPSGDLATIVSRGLDLLLEETLRRRFAKPTRARKAAAASQRHAPSSAKRDVVPECAGTRAGTSTGEGDSSASPHESSDTAAPSQSRHLPSAVRRAVLERDGLRCTWQGPDGRCCESRAWLEHDHVHPRGRGGTDEPANIRLRCRAHNQLSAEQTYGKSSIARIVVRRRHQRRAAASPSPERAPP
jgi:5-methylcytosine-specific restriction endonuclease McrA